MAKKKRRSGGESVAGYFRKIFKENPALLNERSNEALLQRWQQDHPGQEITTSVKTGLANLKSVLRSKGRKRGRKAAAEAQDGRQVAASPARGRSGGLAALEEAIDDCLSLAKAIDKDGLAQVIDSLRRARNLVVWRIGEPG